MTLKMTSAQVVETSVIVKNNSSFQNYTNPDDHTQQTIDNNDNNFKQLYDFMPNSTFRILIFGPSGSGKTTVLIIHDFGIVIL